ETSSSSLGLNLVFASRGGRGDRLLSQHRLRSPLGQPQLGEFAGFVGVALVLGAGDFTIELANFAVERLFAAALDETMEDELRIERGVVAAGAVAAGEHLGVNHPLRF